MAVIDDRRSLAAAPSRADSAFKAVTFIAGATTVGIMLAVGLFLSLRSGDALSVAGPSFLVEQEWSPETRVFGIGAVLFGTFSIAIVAMAVAVPLAIGTALLLSEVVVGRARGFLVSLVDLMAAVPSVVYGLWGLFFLQANVIPVSQWISTYFA